jgi:hypothetical protein
MAEAMARIPEHKQVTRLQLYIIASALWPWSFHPLLSYKRGLPKPADRDGAEVKHPEQMTVPMEVHG